MQRMERYRGHFYNWYDTVSLVPLFPKYISTVDSGNMAAHLVILKQGLLSVPDSKIVTESFFNGLCDTACLLAEYTKGNELVVKFRDDLKKNYRDKLETLEGIKSYIEQLETSFTGILIELDLDTG